MRMAPLVEHLRGGQSTGEAEEAEGSKRAQVDDMIDVAGVLGDVQMTA